MKLALSKKIIIIPFILLTVQICACTYTPWHQEQAEIFLNKGISFIEIRHFTNALKELLEAEKYSPNNHKVHYFLGLAYDGKGMREKAFEEFKKAISLQEDYSEAHNYLGVLYLDMGHWDKAIEEFEKALQNPLYETPSIALFNAGRAYYSKKDYKTALIKYQEALYREPITMLQPQIEKNIGLVYFDQNNFPQAISHLKKSVEIDATLYDAQFILGESYLKVNDHDNAKQAFQAVLKVAPESSFGQKAKSYLQSLN